VTRLEDTLHHVAGELRQSGVPFALVGGLAVSVRTEPRFTRDADLAVAVASDKEAETIIRSMLTATYSVQALIEQEAVGRLATVRLSRLDDPDSAIVDLLFASSGIEREIVAAAELLQVFARLAVNVARTGHLLALKVLARDDVRRPQDLVDLRALLRVASEEELVRAHESLRLIDSRGFHRGRDLMTEWRALRGE
jgi:hypothetical protein